MSFNDRLVKIHKSHNTKTKRTKEDFELYLKAMLEQDYPKVKYEHPDAWHVNKKITNQE